MCKRSRGDLVTVAGGRLDDLGEPVGRAALDGVERPGLLLAHADRTGGECHGAVLVSELVVAGPVPDDVHQGAVTAGHLHVDAPRRVADVHCAGGEHHDDDHDVDVGNHHNSVEADNGYENISGVAARWPVDPSWRGAGRPDQGRGLRREGRTVHVRRSSRERDPVVQARGGDIAEAHGEVERVGDVSTRVSLFLAVAGAIVAAVIAYHEYAYWHLHPHARGPSGEIALLALVVVVLAVIQTVDLYRRLVREDAESRAFLQRYGNHDE